MKNGGVYIWRIVSCKIAFSRLRHQMWMKKLLGNSSTFVNSLSRSRKIILVVIFVLAFLYYLGPYIFSYARPKFTVGDDLLQGCLNTKLNSFQKNADDYDVLINHKPLDALEKYFLPYVGNGHIAAAFDSQKGLYIRLHRALAVPVNFYPIVKISTSDENKDFPSSSQPLPYQYSYVLDIKAGVVYRIQAVKTTNNCYSVKSLLYAHRSRPSVLVQDITINNPTNVPVKVEFDQIGSSGWKGSTTKENKQQNNIGHSVLYRTTNGLVKADKSSKVIAVVVATTLLSSNPRTVNAASTATEHIITVVHYSQPLSVLDAKNSFKALEEKVQKDMIEILLIDRKVLLNEHSATWMKLWLSGFSISNSKASGALNGDKINSTLYYILSSVSAPLHDVLTTAEQRKEILNVLHYPDTCYGDHSTLLATTLWYDIQDEDDVANVVTTWMITLENHGCAIMVKSGAEGVLQAVLLSLGALKFTDHHLEFKMPPKDLHRDFLFHRLNYGNNTHVNISVIVGDDNRANLYVSLDRNDRPYYACDAGCLDAPKHLSKQWTQFPVKQTEPLTAILYITADYQHIDELKHSIHVKEINEAPAHQHHVIALHKHGHHFGGLPTMFWVSIAFLIVIFHLFLFKLIFNEYCQGQDRYYSGYNRGKFSL